MIDHITTQTTINWTIHNGYQSIGFRSTYMRSTNNTHEMGSWSFNKYQHHNEMFVKIETVGCHNFSITLKNRVGANTIIKHCYFSVFNELSWYLWKACLWNSISTTVKQSFSTVTPAEKRYPNINYNWSCDNSHITGGHIIMVRVCGRVFPSNQNEVIYDFISHNITLRFYGYFTITILFSCSMLVHLECPNTIIVS